MVSGIQTFFQIAGRNACYAICIVKIAEHENDRRIEPVQALLDGIHEKHIWFNQDNWLDGRNFFVDNASGFLRMMTGGSWNHRHDSAEYQPKLGEYIIERWENSTPEGAMSHFTLPYWDPLIDSQTVRFGQIVSTRVFWRS